MVVWIGLRILHLIPDYLTSLKRLSALMVVWMVEKTGFPCVHVYGLKRLSALMVVWMVLRWEWLALTITVSNAFRL